MHFTHSPSYIMRVCRLLALLLSVSALNLKAQTYVPSGTMTGTPAAGSYYHNTGITLTTGFTFTASAGQNLLIYIQACVPLGLQADSSQNYIVTSVPRIGGITDNSGLANRNACDLMQTVQYFDGLGRPLQTVQVKGSKDAAKDVIQPVAYDEFSREATKYLPYTIASTPGSYRTNALAEQDAFYQVTTGDYNKINNPVAQTRFEASPLNRPLEQGAPGAQWQLGNHTVQASYDVNAQNEVILWELNAAGNGANGRTFYPAGQLYKTTSTNENGYQTIEFKDKAGNLVCKKTQSGTSTFVTTNYIYNDLDVLVYVMPPVPAVPSAFTEADDVFINYIYGYHYDERNRMIQKKIPGKDWEDMIYNHMDQVVLTQDGVQRARQERSYAKYDDKGRVIMTGVESNHTLSRADIQAVVDGQGAPFWEVRDAAGYQGYTNNSSPSNVANLHPLVVNYYDNYSGIPGLPTYGAPLGASAATNGLLTASKQVVLKPDGTYGAELWTVYYYDDEGRLTATYKQHYLSGAANTGNYDLVTTSYNFTGQDTVINRRHFTVASGSTAVLTTTNRHIYDHMGRETESREKINNDDEIQLSLNAYNELGQLKSKKLFNNLLETAFTYNERGWLKTSSSNQFSMVLKYDDGVVPQFTGNIANQVFTNGGSTNTFNYSYDPLSRLTSGSASGMSEALIYDNLGNITTLSRDGGAAGNYSYTTGNRLNQITGGPLATGIYQYDTNGNATTDGRTGKTFTYNVLNLPATVSGGLSYTYTAAGEKLKQQTPTVTTD
jgi:hypothetical protein